VSPFLAAKIGGEVAARFQRHGQWPRQPLGRAHVITPPDLPPTGPSDLWRLGRCREQLLPGAPTRSRLALLKTLLTLPPCGRV